MPSFSPIYALIDEYAAFKYQTHPMIARAHRALLMRFAKNMKLRRVEQITEEHMEAFVGEELSEFYGYQALKALRQFLWYARKSGHNCIAHNTASKVKLHRQEMKATVETKYEPRTMPVWIAPRWGRAGAGQ